MARFYARERQVQRRKSELPLPNRRDSHAELLVLGCDDDYSDDPGGGDVASTIGHSVQYK